MLAICISSMGACPSECDCKEVLRLIDQGGNSLILSK